MHSFTATTPFHSVSGRARGRIATMLRTSWVALAIGVSLAAPAKAETIRADICVYGGTASGVVAALAAVESGKSVVIVEPHRHVGGIVGGGIRIQRDSEYSGDIGGITKHLLNQDRALGGGAHERQPELRKIFADAVRTRGIRVLTEHRLGSVDLASARIRAIHVDRAPVLEGGAPAPVAAQKRAATIEAQVFIDASYEGDLMALAKVSYATGRESRDHYHESLGGQRHLIFFDVSPYKVPGDPGSGLLPMIDPEPFREGAASRHYIAYNFRPLWVEKGTPLPVPGVVDREKYALAIRSLERRAGFYWPHDNTHRLQLISGGIPGLQSDYADADWPRRSAIWQEWIEHVRTMHVLSGTRVQLQRGQYPDNGDFPDQLYIRLARRMVGAYVMTQHDLMHQTEISDSIGLGLYKVDIYPCRLVAHEGKVATEGETFIRVSPGPYQISYRSLTPRKTECENLLVPVCVSASHVALSSIRMEPTYMVMGEAAGVAASLAVESRRAVQDIAVDRLQSTLRAKGVVLEWNGQGYVFKNDIPWWETTPQDYVKKPIRLDPGWKIARTVAEPSSWASRDDWNKTKKPWDWLFPFIDKNRDGQISSDEYREFQQFKARHHDWEQQARTKLGRK